MVVFMTLSSLTGSTAKRTALELREQVGQLLVMGFPGTVLDRPLRRFLAHLQPGGIILFGRNIEEPKQTWSLLRDCQSLNRVPLLRCVDLEGGLVDRLRQIIAPAPSVEQIALS